MFAIMRTKVYKERMILNGKKRTERKSIFELLAQI